MSIVAGRRGALIVLRLHSSGNKLKDDVLGEW